MAIADVAEYAHLSPEQVEEIGEVLDGIRAEVEASRGRRTPPTSAGSSRPSAGWRPVPASG